MGKLVEDGRRRYLEANAQALAEEIEARSERIRRHYRRRRSTAMFRRSLALRFMQWRHLAHMRREVNGDDNLYLLPYLT